MHASPPWYGFGCAVLGHRLPKLLAGLESFTASTREIKTEQSVCRLLRFSESRGAEHLDRPAPADCSPSRADKNGPDGLQDGGSRLWQTLRKDVSQNAQTARFRVRICKHFSNERWLFMGDRETLPRCVASRRAAYCTRVGSLRAGAADRVGYRSRILPENLRLYGLWQAAPCRSEFERRALAGTARQGKPASGIPATGARSDRGGPPNRESSGRGANRDTGWFSGCRLFPAA